MTSVRQASAPMSLQVSDAMTAQWSPPPSEPAKRVFFQFSATGRIVRSTILESISMHGAAHRTEYGYGKGAARSHGQSRSRSKHGGSGSGPTGARGRFQMAARRLHDRWGRGADQRTTVERDRQTSKKSVPRATRKIREQYLRNRDAGSVRTMSGGLPSLGKRQ
jgi:hypothetical protein